uniref:NADH dehydrogenase subunit 4 n=1 Tax=Eurytoma acutibialis TaxID=3102739 RepID=UPI002E782312|nr:NADH dehydrogenase subunit 4 [Eurytoma acutibialis]WPS67063.1 NADH dehydrogenase subunit 4 [Eurytoma acutibialis]
MMKMYMYMFMLNLLLNLINLNMLMIIMFNLIIFMSFIYLISMNLNFNWMMIYSWLGIDNLSMILVFLSIWIIGLMFFASIKFKNLKFYSFILLLLLNFLYLSFSSMNYFMFYLFFEISLIPTFILIMGWGYQPERINASMHMLLYTMFASLPLLLLLYYLYNYYNSLNYMIMMNNMLNLEINNFILYFYMIFAFLVKLPLFMFHLWLPKAHIEAPVTGSMILAAVLLKLGGYGCMRSMTFMLNLANKFNYLLVGICVFGMIYLSILSMRCNDFKLIVAYSSVVHMGMMMLGLVSMTLLGFFGSLVMMIGHGFCSSALFLMVNYFYERTKSRNMLMNKGMLIFLPSLSMWWFMFCVINMAAPVSLNLLSEIMILMSMFNWSFNHLCMLGLGMYFSAMYSLYLFSYIQHGMFSNLNLKILPNKISEFMNLVIHWIPLNFMVLKLEILL